VQKVRHATLKAKKWKEAAGTFFNSTEKPTMQEAKELLEAGDKLNLICSEIKVLRNAVRTARAWANRVRRCKVDQAGANSASVTKLLSEHDSLMLTMPNEFCKLTAALRGYCICRQPYDGFMVGCDGCGDWYHGPCVGVTEARADKDKFLCVRCCLKKIFKISASTVATEIRKWSDPTELRKARQYEAQKHQRKVRKEKRDIENLALKTESLAAELNGLEAGPLKEHGSEVVEAVAQVAGTEGVAVSPCESETKTEAPSPPSDGQPQPDNVQNQIQTEQSKSPVGSESNGVPPQIISSVLPVPAVGSSTAQVTEDPLMKRKRGKLPVVIENQCVASNYVVLTTSCFLQKSRLN
jgi:hypothetical protein